VGSYRFTRRAESDLFEIAQYTINTWGREQCARYLDGLEDCCQRLADNPTLGRACEYLRPEFRRMQQGKHVVFYRREQDGIVVTRILHVRMLPQLHLDEDGEA